MDEKLENPTPNEKILEDTIETMQRTIDSLCDQLLWARDVLRRADLDEDDYVNPLSEEWLAMARKA